MHTGVKAVIFDWAGTIIDYGCMAPVVAFVEIFQRFGIDLSVGEARGPMGLAKRDHVIEILKLENVLEQWRTKYGKDPVNEDIDKIYAELESAMVSTAKEYAVPIRGAVDLFHELRANEIKLGTTTGYVDSIMKNIIPKVNSLGIDPDAIVTSSQVQTGRPAPYMVYLNAVIMGVYPLYQMIKVGDTVADVKEGLNAGMWTIGVTQSGNELGLSENETDNLLFEELSSRTNKVASRLFEAGAHYVVDGVWDCLPVINEINFRILEGEYPQKKQFKHTEE
jgi:phosphonoacetaldehyde hydrolase